MKEYLLFDLDGTLTDPKIGITTCVQYALKEFGIDEPDLDKLEPFIGPPLKDSFMQFYNLTEEDAERAIAKYRERFSETGIFENEVYAGIPQLLEKLKERGMLLAIASSKPTEYVERILEHFDLRKYFKVVVGSEMDGTRVEKEEVMMEALRMLFSYKPIQFAKVYMVGDRKYDIEASKSIGVECIGVSYGYGSKEELQDAGADHIVESVAELQAMLVKEEEPTRESIVQKVQPHIPAEQPVQKEQAKPTNQQKNLFQILKPFIFPFLMFVLVKFLAENILIILIGSLTKDITGSLARLIFLYDESGQRTTLNGTLSVIITALTYVAAGVFVYKIAKKAIDKTKEEEKQKHQSPEKIVSYIFFTMATIGMTVGVYVLLEIIGVSDRVETYQTLVANSQTANIVVGIICSCIVIPFVEELVFRGMLFNLVKRHYKMWQAILLSSFLYGFSQMNSSEGMYAMVIGCLAAYAYEYYGNFIAPVLVHSAAALVTYLISNTALVNSGVYSGTVCVGFLAIAFIGVRLILHEKNFLNEQKVV